MDEAIESWKQKGFGIKLGRHKKSFISNLRFADDVMLRANSLSQLKKMYDRLQAKHRGTRVDSPKQDEGVLPTKSQSDTEKS